MVYRRRAYGGSRKRILDVASKKKQDTMVTYTNTTAANPQLSPNYSIGNAILTGGRNYLFCWCATARAATNSNGVAGDPNDDSMRTANICYMRGLKERVHIETSSGRAWQWRRICFTLKGNALNSFAETGARFDVLTSQGTVRVVNSFAGTLGGTAIVDLLFQGTQGTDWASLMSAKTDNSRVEIKYDRCRVMQSGNDNGIIRQVNHWFPMNHNLIYDTDENGDQENSDRYSVENRQGMGDYYIFDFFTAGIGGTTSDQLAFAPEATLYWHER